jgi:hypothetical protein
VVTRRELLAAVLSALPLRARNSDFWNEKDPSKWSERDIDRLLTKSPWSKEVTVLVPIDVAPRAGSGPGIPRLGGGIGGIQLPGAGDVGLGGGRGRTSAGRAASKLTCIVRWESAAPILEAVGSALPSAFADHYAISVSGLPQGQEIPPERLKYATSLRANGQTIQPQLATVVPGPITRGYLFGFANEALAANKAVTFQSEIEGLRLTAGFDLTEMTYRGTLAL